VVPTAPLCPAFAFPPAVPLLAPVVDDLPDLVFLVDYILKFIGFFVIEKKYKFQNVVNQED